MELKEGMYIRTNEGIRKILNEFEEGYELDRNLHYRYPEGHDLYKEDLEDDDPYIIKSSYNIIDLIEVGDILIIEDMLGNVSKVEVDEIFKLLSGKIKSIVTKEQFEQMKYEVE